MNKLCLLKMMYWVREVTAMKQDKQHLMLFSAKENAEKWLVDNGFIYGERECIKKEGQLHWFYQHDQLEEYIDVELKEIESDNFEMIWEWDKEWPMHRVDYCLREGGTSY